MKYTFFRLKAGSVKSTLCHTALWVLTLLYLETALHMQLFIGFTASFGYAVGFTAVFGLGIACLLGLLPQKANKIVTLVLISFFCILYCSQVVYQAVFGTMYSVSQIGLGGDAVTSFWKETLVTMGQNLPILLLMLLPIPVTVILMRQGPVFDTRRDLLRLVLALLAVLLQLLTMTCLLAAGTGDFSDYYFYHNDKTTTDQAAERFGLLTTLRLELGSRDPQSLQQQEEDPGFDLPEVTAPQWTVPQATAAPGETLDPTEPGIIRNPYNMLEIDFDYLNTLTKDKKILAMNQYVASLAPTKKNEYTGMLADYNLITICAESFSTGAIQKDLTPTLYKLANEGFVFNNYYNAYPNTTTDGEYSFCLGLWPDISRHKSAASLYASRSSYLPFALGNLFQEQRGIQAYGYHNYKGSFYGRDETHPNMGYQCKFAQDGMEFTGGWPSSDLEMMEQSVGDYIHSGSQFHAYYMTYSGHYQYERYNPMASRNYDAVKDLPYSETTKCYLACNLELEKAMTYLMEQLEKAGIADKTAIVLAGDHFPYGLRSHQYEELVGYELDHFSKYKSTLIFWVGGMEQPVQVDDYMCNTDVLPTILNLWGFEFDSRLLSGRDIFSDAEHIAILRDQSFLTDKVWFNASSGKATWLVEESTVEPDYLESRIKLVQNQFTAGATIVNKAYYNFLFDMGKVKITYDIWHSPKEPDADETTPPEEPPVQETGPVTETAPQETTPTTQPKPPSQETTVPTETTAPTQETTSPTETTAPNQETTSPTETTAPTQETTSPTETTAPSQETTSPTETTAPTQETTAATQETTGEEDDQEIVG